MMDPGAIDVIIPDYLLNESDPLEEDPEEVPQEEENLNSGEELEEEQNESVSIDYTDYLQSIIDNQESVLLNQEIIVTDLADIKADQKNFFSAITSLLVLSAIVFTAFWVVKNIFFKTF